MRHCRLYQVSILCKRARKRYICKSILAVSNVEKGHCLRCVIGEILHAEECLIKYFNHALKSALTECYRRNYKRLGKGSYCNEVLDGNRSCFGGA